MTTAPEMTQVIVHTGERPTVALIGQADRHTVGQLSGAIRGLHAVGIRDLVVDVSRMLTSDPRLLTTLARERARFTDNGGHLTLVGVRVPDVLAALDAAAVDEVFVIYDAVRHETAEPRVRAFPSKHRTSPAPTLLSGPGRRRATAISRPPSELRR